MKVIIDQFTGTKPKGFYWMEGFTSYDIGNKNVLHLSGTVSKLSQKGDASLSNLALVKGFTSRTVGSNYNYAIDNAGYISRATAGTVFTELRDVGGQAGITKSDNPDIKAFTISGTENIIYTSAGHLGKSADDSSFTDNYKTFGTSNASYVRQIEVWEDTAYIGNDNWLASLSDDGTFVDQDKELPDGYSFQSMAYNNNYLLVAMNKNYKGQLGLWDSYTDGWNYLKPLNDEIYAVKAYQRGWIVISTNGIYFTNGYSLEFLATLPDRELKSSGIITTYNGIEIVGDKVIFSNSANKLNRAKEGIWIFDIKTRSFNFSPFDTGTSRYSYYGATGGAIFYSSYIDRIYCGYQTDGTFTSDPYFIGIISLTSKSDDAVFITPTINFGKKVILKSIVFEFLFSDTLGQRRDSPSVSITAKVFNGLDLIWGYFQTNAAASNNTTIKVDGSLSNTNARVGDEVLILDGVNGGIRRQIDSIANEGTNTETWTVDSAMNGNTEDALYLNLLPFTKVDSTRTLTDYSTNRVFFDCGGKIVYGSGMFEFIINHNSTPIIPTSITINYEELTDPNA